MRAAIIIPCQVSHHLRTFMLLSWAALQNIGVEVGGGLTTHSGKVGGPFVPSP
jgi:hypothetical protein